jgi:hypothetical protein
VPIEKSTFVGRSAFLYEIQRNELVMMRFYYMGVWWLEGLEVF